MESVLSVGQEKIAFVCFRETVSSWLYQIGRLDDWILAGSIYLLPIFLDTQAGNHLFFLASLLLVQGCRVDQTDSLSLLNAVLLSSLRKVEKDGRPIFETSLEERTGIVLTTDKKSDCLNKLGSSQNSCWSIRLGGQVISIVLWGVSLDDSLPCCIGKSRESFRHLLMLSLIRLLPVLGPKMCRAVNKWIITIKVFEAATQRIHSFGMMKSKE